MIDILFEKQVRSTQKAEKRLWIDWQFDKNRAAANKSVCQRPFVKGWCAYENKNETKIYGG